MYGDRFVSATKLTEILTIKNDAIYLIEMMDNMEFLLFLFYLTIIEKCKSSLYGLTCGFYYLTDIF